MNEIVFYCLVLPTGIIVWTIALAMIAFFIGAMFGDHSKD